MKNQIAHVGWTDSDEDRDRLYLTLQHLREFGIDAGIIQPKFIELWEGQDFLEDQEEYSIIVLHFLFRGSNHIKQEKQVKWSPLRISQKSSWVNWRKRLAATNADYIIAFGGMGEIGPSFIVDIPGYGLPKHKEPYDLLGLGSLSEMGVWHK